MKSTQRFAFALTLFLILVACTTPAQQAGTSTAPSSLPPVAPIPAALLSAKKIFLSNAGADSGLFPHPFSGGPDRAYNELYASLQALNKYEFVSDPQDADVVFEVQLIAPNGPTNANKQNGASDPLPMVRLVVFDRKTHYVLWAFTESINGAFVQRTHDKNFDDAIAALILDLKYITEKASPPSTGR